MGVVPPPQRPAAGIAAGGRRRAHRNERAEPVAYGRPRVAVGAVGLPPLPPAERRIVGQTAGAPPPPGVGAGQHDFDVVVIGGVARVAAGADGKRLESCA